MTHIARGQPVTVDWRLVQPGDVGIAIERHLYADRSRAYWLVAPEVPEPHAGNRLADLLVDSE